MKRELKNVGFTLVELLIVIALIGVLAVALVATLNPIEQVNKARDARYKNDTSELLAAIERYYASTQSYPWYGEDICGDGGGTTCDNESFLGTEAQADGAGVVDSSATDGNGGLISSGELKPSCRNKEQCDSDVSDENKLHIIKESGSSGAVYVCFMPKAGTNRDPSKNPNLRLWDIFDDAGGYQTPATCDTDTVDWTDITTACFICVPE